MLTVTHSDTHIFFSDLFPFRFDCFFGFPSRQFSLRSIEIYRRNWKLIWPHTKQNKKFQKKNKVHFSVYQLFNICIICMRHFFEIISHFDFFFVFSFSQNKTTPNHIKYFNFPFYFSSFIKVFYNIKY